MWGERNLKGMLRCFILSSYLVLFLYLNEEVASRNKQGGKKVLKHFDNLKISELNS